MTPGARVCHPVHGDGRIVALLAGARVRVVFDDRPRLPRVVQRAALDATSTPSEALPQHAVIGRTAPRRPAFHPETQADAWQAIEALRLGVVPLSRVETYTVGREPQLAALHELLNARAGLRQRRGPRLPLGFAVPCQRQA